MNELISQLWTPELTAGFIIVVVLLLILYVLSIVWVVRDAYMRGTQWYIWAIVALVPGVGLIAYLLLRPPLLQIDRDEQELEIALKQRELMRYGECATCGYPVEADYVLCPNCLTQLKNLCTTCHKALDPAWEVCPYCATPVMSGHRHQPPARAAAPAPESSGDVGAAAQTQSGNPRTRRVGRGSTPISNAEPRPAAQPSVHETSGGRDGAGAEGSNEPVTSVVTKGRPRSRRARSRAQKAAQKQNGAADASGSQPATEGEAKIGSSDTSMQKAADSPASAQKNNPRQSRKTKS